ncbi:MAG: cytochrome c [Bdellovibrionales bacterium]
MKLLIAILGAVSLSAPAMAAGDAARGKTKAASCVACHGAKGISSVPMYPNLAGQHAQYIVAQLKEFKSGKRNNAIMMPMAKPLSEQDMLDLGAYYESLGKASSGGDSGSKKRRRR